jgi:hypothetical protein
LYDFKTDVHLVGFYSILALMMHGAVNVNYRMVTVLNVTLAANVGVVQQMNKQCVQWSLSYAD